MPEAAESSNDWTVLDQKLKTFNRLMTTKAGSGRHPQNRSGRSIRPHCIGTFLSFRPRSDIRFP